MMDIDVVYTWVDGADPDFIASKSQYTQQLHVGNKSNRYHDNGELRYSLRSVHMHAPWVRHIHIITNGQKPDWLNLNHPQIKLVKHAEIFKWKEHLPTFNSQAIECHLHRVPGLAERFIYFNDDCFIGTPVTPSMFFTDSGKIVYHAGAPELSSGPYDPKTESAHIAAIKNTHALLVETFGADKRYLRASHQAIALTKSLMQSIEDRWPEIIKRCSGNRFRSIDDIALCTGLWNNYAYYTQQGEYQRIYWMVRGWNYDLEKTAKAIDDILVKRPPFFCLNDERHKQVMDDIPEQISAQLSRLFNTLYPYASPYEIQANA
jgi:hypothetical protein